MAGCALRGALPPQLAPEPQAERDVKAPHAWWGESRRGGPRREVGKENTLRGRLSPPACLQASRLRVRMPLGLSQALLCPQEIVSSRRTSTKCPPSQMPLCGHRRWAAGVGCLNSSAKLAPASSRLAPLRFHVVAPFLAAPPCSAGTPASSPDQGVLFTGSAA